MLSQNCSDCCSITKLKDVRLNLDFIPTLQFEVIVFTEKESSLISLMALGYKDSEISEFLFLSPSYVPTFIRRVISKYNLQNRCHLIAIFIYSSIFLRNFTMT